MHNPISADALDLYQLIHRDGNHAYLWGKTCDQGSTGTTRWFRPGEAPAVFNSNHNNYHGVHPTTKAGTQYQRAKKGERDIAVINCLYADLDDKDYGGARGAAHAYLETRIADGILPRPTSTINSGGGVQPYWGLTVPFTLDTEDKRADADQLQKRWVAYVGGDDGAKDAARVLRVPGTLNFKYDPPRSVEVIEADYTRLYTLDELAALLPPVGRKPTRQTASTPAAPVTDDDRPDFDKIAEITDLLKRLKLERADNYNTWLNVGMICKDELGPAGFPLWKAWSQKSGKYEPGCCEAKWPTFNHTTGPDRITLGSLKRWANEDDPGGPAALPGDVLQKLEYYKRVEQWQALILHNKNLSNADKVIALVARPVVETGRDLVDRVMPNGSIPVNYEHFGDLSGNSASTVCKSIQNLEAAGLWIRDPELVDSGKGFEKPLMRFQLGDAFDDASLLHPPERKKPGGKRANAGRKPKCATCPPGTAIQEKTTTIVQHICSGCGDVLSEETSVTKRMLQTDEINQVETGEAPYEPESAMFETERTSLSPPISNVEIPPHVDETFDVMNAPMPQDAGSGKPRPADLPHPSILPGVRSGLLTPDDPWIGLQEAVQAAQDGPGAVLMVEPLYSQGTPMEAPPDGDVTPTPCMSSRAMDVPAAAPPGAVCFSLPSGPIVPAIEPIGPKAMTTTTPGIIRPDLYKLYAAQRQAAAVPE